MIHEFALMARSIFPGALFSHLYSMPWYGGLLRGWALENINPGAHVLEMGGCRGELAHELTQQGLQVTVMDKSLLSVVLGRVRAPEVSFIHGDALRVQMLPDRFDLVMAASLLNVVSDPVRLISNMCKAAKPGGRLKVLVPNAAFNDDDMILLLQNMNLTLPETAAIKLWHRKARKLEAQQVTGYFQQVGLKNVSITPRLQGMVFSAEARNI